MARSIFLDASLHATVRLKISNLNIRNCKQVGVCYEGVCSPNHVVEISTEFNYFLIGTLGRYRRDLQELDDEEYFVAFVFILRYFPKSAIFYLRWLFNRKLFLYFQPSQSIIRGGYELVDSSGLECDIDIENPDLTDEQSFVAGDIELFDKLFNHIYNNSRDLYSIFKLRDIRAAGLLYDNIILSINYIPLEVN